MDLWNNLESLKNLHQTLSLLIAVVAILAAGFGGLIFVLDKRINHLTVLANTEMENLRKAKEKELKDKMEITESKLVESQLLYDDALNKIDKLEKAFKGRYLTPQVREDLIHRIKLSKLSIKEIPTTASLSNNEAQFYATEFSEIFKKSGINSNLALPIPGLRPEISGIHIGYHSEQDITDAQILSKIFNSIGLNHQISKMESNFLPENKLVLVIGFNQE